MARPARLTVFKHVFLRRGIVQKVCLCYYLCFSLQNIVQKVYADLNWFLLQAGAQALTDLCCQLESFISGPHIALTCECQTILSLSIFTLAALQFISS